MLDRQFCKGFINKPTSSRGVPTRYDETIQRKFGLLRHFIPLNDRGRVAFTLAEVLMTLAIVGIITAMTVPALMNSTNKTENVVALKKVYETLSQASYMIQTESGGDIKTALSEVAESTKHSDLANIFIPKLNVSKNCGVASALNTGCFVNANITPLDGVSALTVNLSTLNLNSILTNDSTSYGFQLVDATCSSDRSSPAGTTSSPLYNYCGRIWVDINGPGKGPTQCGRDTFFFWITKKGIYPAGTYSSTLSYDDCSTYGLGCTGKVLLEGAMNY